MKYIPCYILCFLFMFSACKKDETPSDLATASITCKVNGEDWKASSYTAEYFLIGDTMNAPLNILLEGSDDSRIQLVLIGYEGNTGTYDVVGEYVDKDAVGYASNGGSITISKFDLSESKLSASFSLQTKNGNTNEEVSISEGSFTNLEVDHF